MTDALLCADGPVRSLPALSLVAEHRRGTAPCMTRCALVAFDVQRLRTSVASVPLPRAADGRIVLAVDVTCWLRPEAHTCPERILCHTSGRTSGEHVGVPGWPYSFVVALETGRTSWTAPLDAVRLSPGTDLAAVTAQQVRDVVARLIEVGHWRPGDPHSWGDPDLTTQTDTRHYGTATTRAWHRPHPRLTRRAAWAGCQTLPILKAP